MVESLLPILQPANTRTNVSKAAIPNIKSFFVILQTPYSVLQKKPYPGAPYQLTIDNPRQKEVKPGV